MIKPIALFLFLFLFFPQIQSEKIKWQENRKLSWADFQGTRDESSSFAATTHTGLHFKYSFSMENNQVEMDYTVESFFNSKKSWYKAEKVSQHILNHEQTHFDITELHARKFRKKLDATRFSKEIKKEMEQIYLHIEEQRKTMQKKFDTETDHSRNINKQLFWENYIAKELRKYESWK